MKILEILPNLSVGGAQTFCVELCAELAKNSSDHIYLISFWDDVSPRFEFLKETKNITLFVLEKKKGFSPSFVKKLHALISKINPDVINTHSDSCLAYLLCIWPLRNCPIYHTISCNPGHYYKKLRFLFRLFINCFKWDISFVAISRSFVPLIKKIYGKNNRVFQIDNGIALPNSELFGSPKKFDFVSCGRLSQEKRFDLLIRSVYECPNKVCKLLIVGDGPERPSLTSLVNLLNLQNRVFFVGATSDPYVFYAVSRFFVLTSSTEGSPVSIMEAMSLGVPAIASDVGGVSDEIENGVDGFVFSPSESPNEIGSLLGFALSDKLKYAQMQARSFEKAKRWYIGKISAQYHDMYLEGTSRVGKK